jgi:hypothetical protein
MKKSRQERLGKLTANTYNWILTWRGEIIAMTHQLSRIMFLGRVDIVPED